MVERGHWGISRDLAADGHHLENGLIRNVKICVSLLKTDTIIQWLLNTLNLDTLTDEMNNINTIYVTNIICKIDRNNI